ncbi:MAG: YihY/virulence factor BrkB family protein [Sphingomonadales bacterium]
MQRPPALTRTLLRYRRVYAVVAATLRGTLADGFAHAGNLAYLSLLTIFPFLILLATAAAALMPGDAAPRLLADLLRVLPPDVARLIAPALAEALTSRASGGLITFGVAVTLWTVTGFIETVRTIIRDAYGVADTVPFWRYRLRALALLLLVVAALLLAFSAQVLLQGVEAAFGQLFPGAAPLAPVTARLWLPAMLFAALWAMFALLTPLRFHTLPIWPAALVTALAWVGATFALPRVLALASNYTLTYGSLAGVIIALLYFYLIGLGVVVGANLNAALAKTGRKRLRAA